jgi:hypothetical protein
MDRPVDLAKRQSLALARLLDTIGSMLDRMSVGVRRALPIAAPVRVILLAFGLASAPGACATAHTTASANPRATPSNTTIASTEPPEDTTAAPAHVAKELPRGGRTLFPDHRLVGFCGTPGAPALGALQGNLATITKTLEAQAAHYAKGRKLLPVFELIAVVVQGWPGPDGKYRRRVDDSVVQDYLRAARQAKGLLLLNIQPGQSDFVTEVKTFEDVLREPDVGLALDPEWAMKGKQRPGVFYGQTTGAILNEVADYLSKIIADNDLPEKPLVFHQVNREVLSGESESELTSHPGVALIKSVDGLGPVHSKIETYDYLMKTMPHGVHPGFKLFFDEDVRIGHGLMTPSQVLALRPQPEYVMYE